MQIKLHLLVGLLVLTAIVISCDKNGDEPEVEPTLSVAPVALSFTAQAVESHEVVVTTNQSSWDAASSQSWCSVTKSNDRFTVTAVPNTSATSPASAVITVTAGTAKSVTINVTQAGVGAQLSVNIDTSAPFTFTSTGGTSEAKTVTTNQSSWNVVSNQTWCTVAKNGNTFTITASANTGSAERTAIVTVLAGSAPHIIIEVKQAGVTSADDYNLKKAGFCLAYIMKVTEDKKKGTNIYNISEVTNVSYNSNLTIDYMDFIYYDAVVPFSYNTPLIISGVKKEAEAAILARNAIGNGSYDYANDPSKIVAYFGSFAGSGVFTSLSNLKLIANNDAITEDIYSRINLGNNSYKIVVYGKNKNGVLIGKYVGSSSYTIMSQLYFDYMNIDPDDTRFGQVARMAIP